MKKRFSKVRSQDFAQPPAKGRSFAAFYNSLPHILKASDLKAVAEAVVKARKAKKGVIFMAGAHVIKCGLNPIVIELIKKKIITCICLNEAVRQGVRQGFGLGYAVASKIYASKLAHKNLSLLYNAYKNNIPVCVFVAVGTDIIHQHPSFNAALTAEGSLRDFHSLVENIAGLNRGGVVLNFGSAVVLPEVFLKALNLSRNLGNKVKDFVTANFDMIFHYRPQQNVVSRPVSSGGKGYYIIGHHEIMLPLLAQAVIEKA
ncbi:MAG: hypothetical protein NT033_05895 [Candidatus Omnitrophica bacterium]|nr:hypothetical protein [Candidatus Omnitrophota bacterium]